MLGFHEGTPTFILSYCLGLHSSSPPQPLSHLTSLSSSLCSFSPFSTCLPSYHPQMQIWSWCYLLRKQSSHCQTLPDYSPASLPTHFQPHFNIRKFTASQSASMSLHICPQLPFLCFSASVEPRLFTSAIPCRCSSFLSTESWLGQGIISSDYYSTSFFSWKIFLPPSKSDWVLEVLRRTYPAGEIEYTVCVSSLYLLCIN